MEIKEVFRSLGLESAFIYAGLTFAFFAWVDSDISPQVKETISRWINRMSHERTAVTASIVQIFDRIYGKKLLSLNTLVRSSLISIVVSVIFIVEQRIVSNPSLRPDQTHLFAFSIYANVLSDYLSLFFIKKLLVSLPARPILTLLLGTTVAALVIFMFLVFRLSMPVIFAGHLRLDWEENWMLAAIAAILFPFMASIKLVLMHPEVIGMSLVPPAIFVHLWLALMGIAVFIIRIGTYFFRTVSVAEKVLKKEESRPLRAIGYVAALFVFLVVTSTSILGRLLS